MKQQLRKSNADAFDVGTDESTVEFELSAQDLLSLSRSGESQGPTPDAAQSGAGSAVEQPVSAQAKTARAPLRRIGLSFSIVVAVVVTSVVLYLYWRPEGAVRSVKATAPQAEAPLALSSPPDGGQELVRFANPFDHTEVFEFPAGTSKTEARDAVAEILMERAQGRRQQHNDPTGNQATDRRVVGITPTEPGKNPSHGASHLASNPGHID